MKNEEMKKETRRKTVGIYYNTQKYCFEGILPLFIPKLKEELEHLDSAHLVNKADQGKMPISLRNSDLLYVFSKLSDFHKAYQILTSYPAKQQKNF